MFSSSYSSWISSKNSNVFLHPFECHDLIPQSQVARKCVIAHGEETKGSEAVVDCHKNL